MKKNNLIFNEPLKDKKPENENINETICELDYEEIIEEVKRSN